MSMSEYRLARELGNTLARRLEIYKTTQLWHSLEKSTPDDTFRGHHSTHGVNALDIEKQEGRFMLSGGADGGVCLWDLDQLSPAPSAPVEPIAKVPGGPRSHKFGISSIIYYPSDPGLFVTASYDKSVKVWDASELSIAFTFNLGMMPRSIAIAPRAYHALVAVSSESPTIRLLDLNSGSAAHSLICGGTYTVNWSPRDEYMLASGGYDGAVRLWDIRMATSCIACLDMDNSGRHQLDTRNRAHEGPANGLTWSECGSSLITLGHDEKMRVWDLATGENTLTSFDPVIRNRRHHTLNPVLAALRQSDPQLVFIPSLSEVVGFHIAEGNVVLKHLVTQHKINTLVYRPHVTELYYGSSGGEINRLVPSSTTENVDDLDDEKEGSETDVLNTIYQSLVQNPIAFT